MARNWTKNAEIRNHDYGDKEPQEQNKFPLRDQICLARFVNQLGDFAHRLMHRQVLQLNVNCQSKQQAEKAKEYSNQQQPMTINAKKSYFRQIGKLQSRLAALARLGEDRGPARTKSKNCK